MVDLPGGFTAENAAALAEFFAQIPQLPRVNPGPVFLPDFEKLTAAREYCTSAQFELDAVDNIERAVKLLICAVDHVIAAWQQ